MEMITELQEHRNTKILLEEALKLTDYLRQSSKNGTAIHEVEQGIWDKLLIMGKQALGQFIMSQGDGDIGEQVVKA